MKLNVALTLHWNVESTTIVHLMSHIFNVKMHLYPLTFWVVVVNSGVVAVQSHEYKPITKNEKKASCLQKRRELGVVESRAKRFFTSQCFEGYNRDLTPPILMCDYMSNIKYTWKSFSIKITSQQLYYTPKKVWI